MREKRGIQMKKKAWGCLAMAAVLFLQATTAFGAAPVAQADETLYLTYDYYGDVSYASVVKSYALHGQTNVTDYGQYASVTNMTNYVKPVETEEGVSFDLSEEEQLDDRFYFEGELKGDSLALPWSIDVSYKLNGVPIAAEKLAGEKGLVELTIDVLPNKETPTYYRNNMMMQMATVLDMDDFLSVEAPGAQVQTVGNRKAVVFMVLPGEEQHFTLRMGSNDFSFPGLYLMMTPITIAQVEDIQDLKEAKDKIEDSADAINASLDVVLSALSSMADGLSLTSESLQTLDEAREIINQAKEETFAKSDAALSSAQTATESAQSLPEHVTKLKETMVQINEQLNEANDTLQETRPVLKDMEESAEAMGDSLREMTVLFDTMEEQTEDREKLHKKTMEHLDELRDQEDSFTEALNDLGGVSDRLPSASGLTPLPPTGDPSTDAMIDMVNQKIDEVNGLLGTLGQAGGAVSGEAGYAFSVLNQMLYYGYRLTGDLQDALELADQYMTDLEEHAEDGRDLTEETAKLLDALAEGADLCDQMSQEADRMMTILNDYEAEGESALEDSAQLIDDTITALEDMQAFLGTVNDTAKEASTPLNEGTQNMFEGLGSALEEATKGLRQTDTIKDAKDTVHDLAKSEWDKWEEENTTLLQVNTDEAPLSFTSPKNQPTSVQVIARTQEIKAEEVDDTVDVDETYRAEGTFLTRVKNVFVALWQNVTGIFQ